MGPGRSSRPMNLRSSSRLRHQFPPLCPWVEPAEVREGTPRALGAAWPTEVFSETDEQLVDMEPVLVRDGVHQSLVGRCGVLCWYVRQHVSNALAGEVVRE